MKHAPILRDAVVGTLNPTPRRWTPEEDVYLRENAFKDVEDLAVELNRTHQSVTSHAHASGLRLAKYNPDRQARSRYLWSKAQGYITRNVEFDLNGGCWIWSGAVSRHGYGKARIFNENGSAHRLAWRAFRGAIPTGLHICHRCDIRCCVNPSHLFLGTAAENIEDMVGKGRKPSRVGEFNTRAKLSAKGVKDILNRISSGEMQKDIARDLGVSSQTICDIKKGRSWTETTVGTPPLDGRRRRGFSRPQRDMLCADQGGVCAKCPKLLVGRWHIDHIIPLALDGPHERSNWQGLCIPCHIEKTRDDIARIAKAKRIEKKARGLRKTKRPLQGRSTFGKGQKLQGRGFNSQVTRGLDGQVRARKPKRGKTR